MRASLRHRIVPLLLAILAQALLPLPGGAASPRVEGTSIARVAITVSADSGGTVRLPGPFAVLPGGNRVAVNVPESEGILLLEGDRILHHFPLPSKSAGHRFDDLEASETLLVAGRSSYREAVHADLFVFDLSWGRMIQRIQSANPYLETNAENRAGWRVVVEGDRVGVFHPPSATTYPLWDRAEGVIAGSDQMVRATLGLGFGTSATWIPNPDGSVDRKLRGGAEPLVAPGEGKFVDGAGPGVVVLLVSGPADAPGKVLPREWVVHVLEGDHTISELRLDALSPAVDAKRLELTGRPVQVRDGRLFWEYLGPDYLEIRSTALPSPAAE